MASLELALVEMMNDYSKSNAQRRDQIEKMKKDAVTTAARVSELLVDSVNSEVQESFINEKRIEFETRALASTVQRYTKQTNQWLTAVRALDSALKEIGDFENWMKIMDYDCESIVLALQYIHKKENTQS
ncbi:hypothetical protein SUGI_0235760 [Cryptomeria japonica]|uniref:biogenesis of lysosome-related organelles complex 1 subunit 1 n=1 Tax=Cryptomeria japonica TaxID=3369 RepID=UPI002408DF6B|nr:biogenesis of lysosome-related organelles complex 1 subunit 1 [Cryptomeria japonica]GLJ14564.1 hypothetical protein SUGI_0235760 [Cryptomeria japonica]